MMENKIMVNTNTENKKQEETKKEITFLNTPLSGYFTAEVWEEIGKDLKGVGESIVDTSPQDIADSTESAWDTMCGWFKSDEK